MGTTAWKDRANNWLCETGRWDLPGVRSRGPGQAGVWCGHRLAQWVVRPRAKPSGRTGCRSRGRGPLRAPSHGDALGREGWLGGEVITQGPSRNDTGPMNRILGSPRSRVHTCARTCTHCPPLNCQRALLHLQETRLGWVLNPEKMWFCSWIHGRDPEGLGRGAGSQQDCMPLLHRHQLLSQPRDWRARRGRGPGRAGALGTATPTPTPTVLGSPGQQETPPWAGAHVGKMLI